jgi:hypothetical protein
MLVEGVCAQTEKMPAMQGQNNPDSKKLIRFEEYETIPTLTAHRIIFFTIGKHAYLAVANSASNTGANQPRQEIGSVVYKWNGRVWATHQEITTIGAIGLEFFTIDKDHFLAIAQTWNGYTSLFESPIYKWSKRLNKFIPFQKIMTQGAYQWKYFSIDGKHFLAIANFCSKDPTVKGYGTENINTTTGRYCPQFNTTSVIYKWDKAKSEFSKFQEIFTFGATDFEFFSIEKDHFLAVANFSKNYNQACPESQIYKWNKSKRYFVLFQEIDSCGATCLAFFSIGNQNYLAVANWANETTTKINSVIYNWNGSEFVSYQEIPTVGAHFWLPFTIGDNHYLQLANFENNEHGINNLDINSAIYIWEEKTLKFKLFQWIPTSGALPGCFFLLDCEYYLAIANYGTNFGQAINGVIDSKIYRAVVGKEQSKESDHCK